MKFDMHSHTTDSDGYLDYKKLIDYAKNKKVNCLAITNHDSINNLKEAYEYGLENKVNIIYGVELSTYLNDESVHVLGYFKSLDGLYSLKNFLDNIKLEREERTKKMIINLKEFYNIDISFSSFDTKKIITRGNIAKVILAKYPNYTKEELFKDYGPLAQNGKAFVPSTQLNTFDGIDLLKKYNAFVSIAHPTLLKKNKIEDILDNTKSVDAIEAIYPLNKKGDYKKFKKIAKKYNILYTAGSDFHFHDDKQHGNVGDSVLKGFYAKKILRKIKEV